MSTEIARVTPAASLPDMVRYAEHLANSGLLPKQYVRQPSNVLYAMEYGRTLGITPIAAITGIHVIEGKPSSSAGLISGLVRQAGHKLRVTGNGLKATATIIRSDDPDHEFSVTWELRRNAEGNPNAEDAGLLKKDIWSKYPAAMLKARAITQVARDACEEVLFGLHYTPEELGASVDQEGNILDAIGTMTIPSVKDSEAQGIADMAAKATLPEEIKGYWASARDQNLLNAFQDSPDTGLLEMLREYLARRGKALSEAAAPAAEAQDIPDAEVVDAEVVEEPEPEAPAAPNGEPATAPQMRLLHVLMGQLGLTERAEALEYVAGVIGRQVQSRNELTKTEMQLLLDHMQAAVNAMPVAS